MKNLLRLPRTLAGQFTLLLALALIMANAAAFYVLNLDRGWELQTLRRNAQIERLIILIPALNALQPDLREGVVHAASGRRMRLSLDTNPLVQEQSSSEGEEILSDIMEDRLDLPADASVRVMRLEDGAAQKIAHHRGNHNTKRWFSRQLRHLTVIHISIPLSDGTWLNARQLNSFAGPRLPGRPILMTLILSFAAVLAVGLLFIRRLTKPLKALSSAAGRAGRGDRTAEIPEKGAAEIREAAHAFNTMQADISRFDAERARTVAAIGHDLRTPITSLRLRTEMVEDVTLRGPMIQTLDDMKVMAEELLYWGSSQGNSEPAQKLNLTELLHDVFNGSVVSFSGTQSVSINARPVALRRAFTNLAENTRRYAGKGSAKLSVKNGNAIVTLEDTGPGISPDRLKTLFQPFARGEASRSRDTGGHGLGLSIVKSVVVSHGGSIVLENRTDETGLMATVTLPTL